MKNIKTVAIIGNGGTCLSNSIARVLADKIHENVKCNVITVDMSDWFEVNGVTYEPIKTKPSTNRHSTIEESMIYLPYINMFGETKSETKSERKLSNKIDIIKEYGLIENKQSKLSKWEREMVVKKFLNTYRKVNTLHP